MTTTSDHGKITVISQSFGATEETFTSYAQLAPLRAAYQDAFAHGVTVLAATGDDGRDQRRARRHDPATPRRSPAGRPPTRW